MVSSCRDHLSDRRPNKFHSHCACSAFHVSQNTGDNLRTLNIVEREPRGEEEIVLERIG